MARVDGAWEDLVEEYASLVWTVCQRFGSGVRSDTEEAFQRTFIRIWQKLDTVREPARLAGWIATTARRVVSGQRERKRVRKELLENAAQEARTGDECDDADLGRLEIRQIVREAVAELRSPYREVLDELFFRGEGPNYNEVAQKLGMAPGSVGPVRSRALEMLRKYLLQKYDGFLVSNFKADLS